MSIGTIVNIALSFISGVAMNRIAEAQGVSFWLLIAAWSAGAFVAYLVCFIREVEERRVTTKGRDA